MRRGDGQQGFVSLFTTIMLSLLLLVITMSMVTLEALQLRKSEDAEQTLRAYYTAEAGVEDAVGKVLSVGKNAAQNTCSSDTNYDIPGAAGWTCQLISFTGSPTGQLNVPDQAQTIDPYDPTGGGQPYKSVIVEFNQDSSGSACYYDYTCRTAPWGSYPGGNPPGFPSTVMFAANPKAAPVELSIVQYPHNGFSANEVCTQYVTGSANTWQPAGCNVKLQNAVVAPAGAGGAATINYSDALSYSPVNSQPFGARCSKTVPWNLPGGWGGGSDRSNAYHCAVLLENLPTGCGGGGGTCDYLFRIRSRYGPSSYKFVFMNQADGGGSAVQVPTGSALIDVTAKAGQTYRRVISRLPLGGEAAAGLNYVMYSDTDVCKNFTVIDNVAQPDGCPYSP